MTIDLGAVAAFGLPGAPVLEPAAGGAGDDEEWFSLLTTAANERATGFVFHAVASGALAVTDEQRAALQRVHELELADCLRLEALLVLVGDELDRRGIEWRVLKGPAFAHRWYGAPEWRTFGDIDLLVRGRAWDAAAGRLGALAFQRRFAEPRPGFTARFGKGACFVSPTGLEIDLHRTFVAGPFGLGFDADNLFAGRDSVTVGGRTCATLDGPASVVHAAVHAVLGAREPRLVALRDVAQMLSSGVDPDAVRDRAQRWGMAYPVARAVVLAHDRLRLTQALSLHDWAVRYLPPPAERRALAVYASERRSYAAQALAGVAAVHGVRNRVAYVRALALPSNTYLGARDRLSARRLVRATRLLGQWRSPRQAR